jgi:hypothetical protein
MAALASAIQVVADMITVSRGEGVTGARRRESRVAALEGRSCRAGLGPPGAERETGLWPARSAPP